MAGARDLAGRLLVAADLWDRCCPSAADPRREHPGATEAVIDRLLALWLQERLGAEAGAGPQDQS